jgi:biopolymer transport protein ExbD
MDEKQFDHINAVPLIDIMLVLLTIVLTTSTLVATGHIPLQLPQATTSADDMLKTQTIEIDKRGTVYLNSAATNLAALDKQLIGLEKTTPILIRADKSLVLQAFVDVLDVVKKHSFTRVGLQTESAK